MYFFDGLLFPAPITNPKCQYESLFEVGFLERYLGGSMPRATPMPRNMGFCCHNMKRLEAMPVNLTCDDHRARGVSPIPLEQKSLHTPFIVGELILQLHTHSSYTTLIVEELICVIPYVSLVSVCLAL